MKRLLHNIWNTIELYTGIIYVITYILTKNMKNEFKTDELIICLTVILGGIATILWQAGIY